MSGAWLLARRFGEAFLAGLLAGVVLLVLAPVAIGWRPYTVLTGSMRPGIQPGDVVMDRPIAVSDMHVGDVVTFSDPSRHGNLVTHRVRSIAHGTAMTTVETRGDANNTSEHWTVQTKDRVGRVVFVMPKIGKVAVLVRNPLGIGLLVVLPVIGLGFLALRSIWREEDEDGESDDDGGDAGDGGSADERNRRSGTAAGDGGTAGSGAGPDGAPTDPPSPDAPQTGGELQQAATPDAPSGGDR